MGRAPEVGITRDMFERLSQARRGISETLGMEEKYDLVLENYVEFEASLLESTLAMVVHTPTDWSDFVRYRHVFNRRLLNLLAAGRLLLDQLRHHVSTLFGNPSAELDRLEETIRTASRERFGFRCIEALRNHVQHRDLPVGGFSQQNWRVGPGRDSESKATVTPLLSVSKLSEDPKFKRSVLAELKEISEDSVDLKPLVREWVSCLGEIQQAAREIVEELTDEWDTVFHEAIQTYRREAGEDLIGLAAIERDARRAWRRRVFLTMNPSKRRDLLRKRNRLSPSLGDIDITSASKE